MTTTQSVDTVHSCRVRKGPGSSERFEQEFQNLQVSFRVSEGVAPGIEAVPPEQHRMRVFVLRKDVTDAACQARHVLVVLEDGNPFAMLVRGDTLKALEHFVSVDAESASRRVEIGHHRAPHRMRVHDCTGAPLARDREVEQCLRGGPPLRRPGGPTPSWSDQFPSRIDCHDVGRAQCPFVAGARRDGQPERVAGNHGAEVATRAECPSSGMTPVAQFCQCPRDVQGITLHSSFFMSPARGGERTSIIL